MKTPLTQSQIEKCKATFFENTFAQFNEVSSAKTEQIINTPPDHISYKKEQWWEDCLPDNKIESSRYWYTDKGVYRYSDHWEIVGKCAWVLNEKVKKKGKVLAFCSWDTFYVLKTIDPYKVQNNLGIQTKVSIGDKQQNFYCHSDNNWRIITAQCYFLKIGKQILKIKLPKLIDVE